MTKFSRLLATAAFFAFTAGALSAGAQTALPRPPANPTAPAPAQAPLGTLAVQLTGTERTQTLARASKALDGVRGLQGRFQQLSADGSTQTGAFHLSRPGKLRFEYDKPSQMTLISDGVTVAFWDRSFSPTPDTFPLRSTPLFFVLKRNIDLEKDAKITEVARLGPNVLITARDKGGQTEGSLTLVLDAATLALKQWRVVDPQGGVTQLSLLDPKPATKVDAKLFLIPQGKSGGNRLR
jgi:outer membrane lipoprotein-sorting protein